MIEPIRNGILAVEGAADNVEEEMLQIEKENNMSVGNSEKENSMVSCFFQIIMTDFVTLFHFIDNFDVNVKIFICSIPTKSQYNQYFFFFPIN